MSRLQAVVCHTADVCLLHGALLYRSKNVLDFLGVCGGRQISFVVDTDAKAKGSENLYPIGFSGLQEEFSDMLSNSRTKIYLAEISTEVKISRIA
ncbi:hypothetical protein J1614_006773 [Plenodomus biglobosus]|nr:hypothetical protein J1614_006773 [Plenodomus biglobosus]